MHKAFLISILIATMVIPLRAARIQDRRKAIARMDRQLFVYCVLYVAGLAVLDPMLRAD